MTSGAVFSPCRTWRYELHRVWDESRPAVAFVGLNPSTADETVNDPTIRRCIGFAQTWGYGRLVMVNLFAFRATDPRDMRAAADPIGPANDAYLERAGYLADLVVVAWGAGGTFQDRDRDVLRLLRDVGANVRALGFTKDGQPRHPLYLRADSTPLGLLA